MDSRPPNIVLMICDDLAWGDLACHGNPYIRTPHLDALHAESTRLTRYISGPVCTPARASLMTGRYPYRTRAIDTYCGRSMMAPDEVTLPQVLRESGYATCLSGKWHLGDCYPLRPTDRGFDEALHHNGGGLGQVGDWFHWGSKAFTTAKNRFVDAYFDPPLLHNRGGEARVVPGQGYCTDIFFDHAMAWIEGRRDRPWFAYVATPAPHDPLEVNEAAVQAVLERNPGLRERDARLYAMVENIDFNVGRMIARLDGLGLTDETIVIFTSDHGPAGNGEGGFRWNGGLRGGKSSVYEGGVRVPMMWRWPGRLAAGRGVGVVSNPIDLMPTLAEVSGAALPGDRVVDGVSLWSVMRGDGAEEAGPGRPGSLGRPGSPGSRGSLRERAVFVQCHRGDVPQLYRNCSVTEARWKLVDGRELYDLPADPGEQRDVAAEHPEEVARLRGLYEAWFEDVSHERADNYAPPRMHAGTHHEPTTWLTLQDWRVHGPDSWTDDGQGHWELRFEPGVYDAVLRFRAMEESGRATLTLGDAAASVEVAVGDEEVAVRGLTVTVREGTAEVWLMDVSGVYRAAMYVGLTRRSGRA